MQTENKLKGSNIYLSILTLNINDQNSPIKRHRLGEQIKKLNLYTVSKKQTSPSRTDTILRWKDGKKIFQANGTKKEQEMLF